jgi:hypothetical protein
VCFSAYKQPLLYNLAVGKELVKQVYVKEGLHPPSFATVREVYADLAHQLRSPGYISGLLKSGEVGRIGVYGLQAYGLFKVRSWFRRDEEEDLMRFGIDWRDGWTEEHCWIQAR